MTRNRKGIWLGLGLLAVMLMAGGAQAQYDVPANYPTIEAAVAAAPAGTTINVADGTYAITSTLSISKSLTILGASEAGVIINLNTGSGWGINPAADNITMSNMTLAVTAAQIGFPIHASGTSAPGGTGYTGLNLSNITIAGPHQRTGFDIHGYNDVVLSYLTSSDATGGNGVQVTGCVGVDLDNITTSNNEWGSIAIYASGPAYMNRASNDVFIDALSCTLGEGNIYNENDLPLVNTNIVVDGYGYAIGNIFAPNYTWYQETEANAVAAALAGAGSYIKVIADGSFVVADGMGIQPAIDAANPGDTINVGAGHFEEQLHINKDDLTIIGAGMGTSYVDSPADLVLFYATSNDNYPVVFIDSCMGLNMSGFTVDGLGRGNANYRFQGVAFWNAGGALSDLHVVNVMDTPFSGSQHGIGIYAYNNTGGPYAVTLTDILVDTYQKGGVVMAGDGLTADLTRVTTVGAGSTDVTAQNGLQVSYGTTGTITDCDVSGNHYSPGDWWASGVLLYDAGMVTINDTDVDNSQGSISINNGSAAINGGSLTNVTGAGVGAYSWIAKAASRKGEPQPSEENHVSSGKAATAVTVDGVVVDGTGTADAWGVDVWTDDQLEFTMTNSTITACDVGLSLAEDAGGVITGSASGNFIEGNTTFGGSSNTAAPFDARNNWWGDASGPFHPTLNAAGTGNEVSDHILFEPWTGLSFVDVVPVINGPYSCGQPVTVTFQLTVDAYTPDVFGYNAIVRAPAALLDWGTITDELPFGVTNIVFQAYDQEDGSFNIAGSTVGSPTSPITEPGVYDLFSVVFTTLDDGVADITFDSFSLRDPNNAPIAAAATGAQITIDCTAPVAVADIDAEPHHRKVAVSWTHDGVDTAVYEVYRGLWYNNSNGESAYPEYDDLDNDIIPTRPSSRAVAQASGQWELAGTVAVGTTVFDDIFADGSTRGVYYYEVFAVDAADNGSLVAPANDRATNYWLGDVDDSGTVDPYPDINDLGTAFGTSEGHASYSAFCDVGPTDDSSRTGIPTTDNHVNFEDLMIFSMNFGLVSPTNKNEVMVASSAQLEWVTYDEGRYALRLVSGSGLKGLRVTANLPDGSIGEVTAGSLLDEQSELTFLQNVGAGLDVSLAVMGTEVGFSGTGDLFIVNSSQPIGRDDISSELRGVDNSEIEVSLDTSSDTLTPRVFALNANYPNPFNPMTKISFSLPEAQNVKLAVYSLDGRKVASLVNETRQAGLHEILWTGRDDAGRGVASGTYFYRIDAGPYSEVRKMTLMK